MNATKSRRETIRRILAGRRLSSQEELLQALAEHGVQTTQPVLSRDLRALKAAKRGGVYQLLESEQVTPLESLRSLLRSCARAGPNLVIVRCEPGAASAVARALESERMAGLVGTVAGDDTVFAAIETEEAGDRVRARVERLL